MRLSSHGGKDNVVRRVPNALSMPLSRRPGGQDWGDARIGSLLCAHRGCQSLSPAAPPRRLCADHCVALKFSAGIRIYALYETDLGRISYNAYTRRRQIVRDPIKSRGEIIH